MPLRRLAIVLTLLCLTPAPVLSGQNPTPVHVPAATLDSYVGEYSLTADPDWHLSFFRDRDRLYCEGPRTPRTILTAESDTVFTADKSQVHYTFTHATSTAPAAVRISGETTWDLVRISTQPVPNHFRPYARQEVMIPMRDGIQLHAVILRPKDTREPLPFLMQRTPYGVDLATSDTINAHYTELAQSGYIFVMEDIRGRYKSQGAFVMMRPLAGHHDPHAIDESTDTYDTVAWLLTHVPRNNGRVGVLGTSYPGFLAAEAGIDPHPAIRAISPQAPMTDVWLGDDFFHNGAFRQTYGYDYVLGVDTGKNSTLGNPDEYTTLLKYGSFAAAIHAPDAMSGSSLDPTDKSAENKSNQLELLATWQDFLDHPAYDDFWRSRAVQDRLTTVAVPTLEVGGWWDQEDLWGPQAEYAALESDDAAHNQPADPAHRVFMVLGPWYHGSWASTSDHLGPLDFREPVGDEFRQRIEAPFFAYYLKDQPGFTLANTATYQTGTDRWMFYTQWPPKNVTEHDLYLDADGSATFTRPADPSAFKAYTSDPANPVPYRRRPIEATYGPDSHWYTWLVQDQRPDDSDQPDGRRDVATFVTPPLDRDVTVTGNVIADLIASTSGTDSDWIVKLIDVFPGAGSAPCPTCLRIDPSIPYFNANPSGYELMIADEIFRGRYRLSFEHPAPIPANTPEEYKFSLHAADHVFFKGHRIMVQVQSTWFPLYDRNPQTFVPNIMTAQPSDYHSAVQHIYAASHLELPEPQ